MYSCRDGSYDSLAVTFKRKHDDIKNNYEKNGVYVFYSKSSWCYLSLLSCHIYLCY